MVYSHTRLPQQNKIQAGILLPHQKYHIYHITRFSPYTGIVQYGLVEAGQQKTSGCWGRVLWKNLLAGGLQRGSISNHLYTHRLRDKGSFYQS